MAINFSKSDFPLVSIVVSNYNYGRFLPAAIDSALEQCYSNCEVIVVDDGSTDNSREVALSYADQVLPVFKANEGQGSAINAGFERSHGEIVIFLDADDVLLPDTAQGVVEAFRVEQNVAKVMYRMEVIDAAGRLTGRIKPHPHLPLRSGDLRRHMLTFPFDMTWMATSGNAFAAWVLREILPIPEEDFPILADFYLSHLAPLFGPVTFLRDVGAYYRVHGTNSHEQLSIDVELAHIRRNLLYAQRTCFYIKQVADQLGLKESPAKVSALLSVALLSKRLISLKLDASGHPFAGDTSWSLIRMGIAASWRRFDVSWPMKILYTLWFMAMLPAPKPMARWLAGVFSFPERRQPVNRLLRIFHQAGKG